MNIIECKDLSKVYRNKKALDNMNVSITENKITGLIGRNGAGKTTLLKVIAGFLKETSGEVHVFSNKPFNNLTVAQNTILIDDNMTFPPTAYLIDILKFAKSFYPNWNEQLADGLFKYFSFNPKQYHYNLSKGMKSTFNMIIGLSACVPLTLFDEPTTGMDAAVRKDFYRALLKDYLESPRTIILSSHLLNEIEDILEDILLIKDGKNILHTSIDDLKKYAIAVSGKTTVVTEFTKNLEILHQKSISEDHSYVVVRNSSDTLEKAQLNSLQISTATIEDLCVYLTNKTKGGIDDVFSKN